MQAFPAGGGELLHEDGVMQCWMQVACAGYLSNWFPGDQAMVHWWLHASTNIFWKIVQTSLD